MRIQWVAAKSIRHKPQAGKLAEPVVVLWSGEKRQVWESVQVSTWMPKLGLVGRLVIGAFEVLYEYATCPFYSCFPTPTHC